MKSTQNKPFTFKIKQLSELHSFKSRRLLYKRPRYISRGSPTHKNLFLPKCATNTFYWKLFQDFQRVGKVWKAAIIGVFYCCWKYMGFHFWSGNFSCFIYVASWKLLFCFLGSRIFLNFLSKITNWFENVQMIYIRDRRLHGGLR